MNTYKVSFELIYPYADNDMRESYVLAKSFEDAESKVQKRHKDEYKSAHVKKIELLEAEIIV